MTVPPVNSTDRCSPRWIRKKTAKAKVTKDTAFSTSAWRMNGMVRWIRQNSMMRPYLAATALEGLPGFPGLTGVAGVGGRQAAAAARGGARVRCGRPGRACGSARGPPDRADRHALELLF